jgi:hypothetical protein
LITKALGLSDGSQKSLPLPVDQLRQVLAAQSSTVELFYKQGGGRGIASHYRLQLVEKADEDVVFDDEHLVQKGHLIRYARSSASEITPFFLVCCR